MTTEQAPLTDTDLTAIEASHRPYDGGCHECGQTYPCDAADLVAEVRRLRAALMQWGVRDGW